MKTKSGVPEIVIPVMGPTGAGKSSFINEILKGPKGQDDHSHVLMKVGTSLSSCTKEIMVVPLPFTLHGTQILLVDTPGFDDSLGADRTIIERIANWLKNSYDLQAQILGGVIYLHDISEDRFSGAANRSLELFESLCGAPAFDKIIIGTTKRKRVSNVVCADREEELRMGPWKSMIDKGTRVVSYRDDYNSARAFVDQILDRLASDTILEIQKELIEQKLTFQQTKVAQRYIQHQILQIANERAIAGSSADVKRLAKEQQKLLEQLTDAPDSLLRRIRRLFDIKIARFHW